MLKSTFRYIILFFAIALISTALTWGAYYITKSTISEDKPNATPSMVSASPLQAEPDKNISDTMEFESYIVRLEDSEICVYALSNHTEEFLYSTNIYRPNLSNEDIVLLTSGVTLNTSSELTGFMENYTS